MTGPPLSARSSPSSRPDDSALVSPRASPSPARPRHIPVWPAGLSWGRSSSRHDSRSAGWYVGAVPFGQELGEEGLQEFVPVPGDLPGTRGVEAVLQQE